MSEFDAAIIGDGFCGLMTAAQLVRSGRSLKIAVVGKSPSKNWGPGLAYGRCHPQHLLNVPAGKMSAYPDAPDHFLRWLTTNIGAHILKSFESAERPLAQAFVLRCLYGDYLRDIAKEILPDVTYLESGELSVTFTRDVFSVSCKAGDFFSKNLILATGVPAPVMTEQDPKLTDPWDIDFSVFRNSEKPVVILGTGLTMIDVVSSLAAHDFRGEIIAISRRGLLPLVHAAPVDAAKLEAFAKDFLPLTGTLARKIRAFRKNAGLCVKNNISWQAYIDYIRPRIPELWRGLTPQEQKKFLARIFPYWNIHRHRQPQTTDALLNRLIKSGQLEIRRGAAKIPEASHIFNCRGPDYSLQSDSFLQKLLADGLLQINPNGIGVLVDESFAAAGKAKGKLLVLGGLTSGVFLEATAVPELRAQCEKIAGAFP
jgi:uncharacterized NAD(P)/FAD-binding protein YdhS